MPHFTARDAPCARNSAFKAAAFVSANADCTRSAADLPKIPFRTEDYPQAFEGFAESIRNTQTCVGIAIVTPGDWESERTEPTDHLHNQWKVRNGESGIVKTSARC